MPLDAPYDPDNIFARMLRGEVPCHKVAETEHSLAFMDLFPQAPGHTLVVPRFPARTLLDLPADRLGPWMADVQRVGRAVRRAFDADGLTVLQFNGAAGGQTVFHLHMHLIPRVAGDSLQGHGRAGMADAAILAEQARRIAAELDTV